MDLTDFPFDVKAFAKLPKCVGEWTNGKGAGCLITALGKGFGFTPTDTEEDMARIWTHKTGLNISHITFLNAVDCLAAKLLKRVEFHCPSRYYKFTSAVICAYDDGFEVDALNLIWELIETLPNKVDIVKIGDVVMPKECANV